MALVVGCGRSDGPGQVQAARPREVLDSAPAPCGTIAFVHTLGEGPAVPRLISADGSDLDTFEPNAMDRAGSVSRYPVNLSAGGSRLLVLRSTPTPSGKTHDGLEFVDLHGGFGRVEALSLTNPVEGQAATPEGLEAVVRAGRAEVAERDSDDAPQASRLAPLDGQLRNPRWSPDGRFIVFESDANSFRDLYRFDLESGTVLRLTDDEQGNFEPAVSPDSARIAFVSSREGNAEVFVMGADGATPIRLTDSPGDDTNPHWSPKGDVLAFISARDRKRGLDVYLMASDGTEQRPLRAQRDSAIVARDLAFSPTGTELAVTQVQPGGGATIGVYDVASGSSLFETDVAAGRVDEQPAWAPDGRHLVFSRSTNGASNLMRIASDGSGLEVLTHEEGSEWLPRWFADSSCDSM